MPAATFDHVYVKGLAPTLPTSVDPPRRKSTRVTLPSESVAVAERVSVAGATKLALFGGDVSVTVGGTFAFTWTLTGDDSVVAPALS